MGSFRLSAGRGHLHPQCNFAESLVETVRMLLCHSCRSELRVDSTVSRGTDYTFTCSERPEYVACGVLPFSRWVHLDCESNYAFESVELEVSLRLNQLADVLKPLHVGLLRRHQWKRDEVGKHSLHQVIHVSHFVLDGLVGSIRSDRPAVPSLLHRVQQLSSVCILADRKARSNLPPESMSSTRLERNAETALAVHEARDVRIQVHR